MMKCFVLRRDQDISGISGTGVVAEGIQFSTGKVCLAWLGAVHSMEEFDSIDHMELIHGHEGATKTVWDDEHAPMYYECHITVEPVFDDRLDQFKKLCKMFNFHVADLLLRKRQKNTEERSAHDSFCTARDINLQQLSIRMTCLIELLVSEGFKVWRYKIEDTLIDSNVNQNVYKLEQKTS